MLVQIVLFDGFDPLDVVAPYEVFWAGGIVSAGALSVALVSAEGARAVRSGSGDFVLHATASLDPLGEGLIIVPGAVGCIAESTDGSINETIPAILARTTTTMLPELMKIALENPEVTVATVCGGSLALAMAGLIDARHAVTHHLGMDVLGATGTIPVRARIVDDGDFISAAGVTSGLDLALYLLEREVGPRIALAVEELFEYERRGTVWRCNGLDAVAM